MSDSVKIKIKVKYKKVVSNVVFYFFGNGIYFNDFFTIILRLHERFVMINKEKATGEIVLRRWYTYNGPKTWKNKD